MTEATSRNAPLRLSPRELSLACACVLVIFTLGVAMTAMQSRWFPHSDAWELGGDFIELYSAGRVLHDGQGERLYDLALEAELNRELSGTTELKRAFTYPPFVAILLEPLATLPYRQAFIVFLFLITLVYIVAVLLLLYTFGPESRDERALAFLAAVSFFPFLGYTWLGAQISVIGVTAIAAALAAERGQRYLISGFALSVCLYKPSLLVLAVPMLVVTARFRTLVGLVIGGGILAAVSVLGTGVEASLAFVDKLTTTSGRSLTAANLFNACRYVDLNAFFRLLPGGRSPGGYALQAAAVGAAGVALVRMWLRSRTGDAAAQMLVWAATLTCSLVINIYTPFYDTLLVVPAAVLAVAARRARGCQQWNHLSLALVLVYVTPWIAEGVARTFRIQIYTLVLAAFGTVLVIEANRSFR